MDQSIQPGDGGFGFIPELQAFKAFGRFVGFVSGSYLINPRETNDFNRNGPNGAIDRSGAENHLLSVADQYAARIGVATAVKTVGVNLGLRWEGTRGSDLIGGDRGRRRPGYTLGLDPGLSYRWHGNFVSLNVPIAIRRVRNQNFADKLASEETWTLRERRRRLRGLRDSPRVLAALLVGPSRRGRLSASPFPSLEPRLLRKDPPAPRAPPLFFVSGALGLVYEVLWMRWFTTLFGATTLATTATLSGFFLGLAAGSRTFGERSKRWRRPVRAFGLLEIGVGLGALLVHPILDLYRQAYPVLYPLLSPFPAGFALVKLLLALAAIGIPTFCMGGTLPALGQAIASPGAAPRDPGRRPVRDQPARRDPGHADGSFRPPSTSRPGRELRCAVAGSLGVGLTAYLIGSATPQPSAPRARLLALGRVAHAVRRGSRPRALGPVRTLHARAPGAVDAHVRPRPRELVVLVRHRGVRLPAGSDRRRGHRPKGAGPGSCSLGACWAAPGAWPGCSSSLHRCSFTE